MKSSMSMLDAEVPQDFVRTAGPSRAVRKRRIRGRAAASAFLVLLVISTLAVAASAAANFSTALRLQSVSLAQANPSFRARYDDLGALVVQAWIEADQPVVDLAQGVQWPDIDDSGIDVASVGFLGGRTQELPGSTNLHETLTYVVVAADGGQYTASVNMGIIVSDGPDGALTTPVLLAPPMIEPRESVRVLSGAGNPGWPAVSIGEDSPLIERLRGWAEAWTSNDASALKSLAGDSSETTYVGLDSAREWSVVPESVSVQWAVQREAGDAVVVRLNWAITASPVQEAGRDTFAPLTDDVAAPRAQTLFQAADLLIADADTALPLVVDWGAPGTFESLQSRRDAGEGSEA